MIIHDDIKLSIHFDDILHVFTSVSIVFLDRDGDKIFAKAKVGASFLDIAIDNDVELEGIFQGFFITKCQLSPLISNLDGRITFLGVFPFFCSLQSFITLGTGIISLFL